MRTVLLLDLLYAAGIAISPTPVVVVILMLFGENVSAHAQRNALAFLIGWIIGLAILGVLIYWLTVAGILFVDMTQVFTRAILPLLLGVALLFVAVREWQRAALVSEHAEMPRWLAKVDEMISKSSTAVTPKRALSLAVVMSALSPKNIMLVLAVTLAILQANVEKTQQFLLLVIFIIVSSITIGIPVVYTLIKGEAAAETLVQWKGWLLQNTVRMAAIFLFFIGALLIIKSLGELLGQTFA